MLFNFQKEGASVFRPPISAAGSWVLVFGVAAGAGATLGQRRELYVRESGICWRQRPFGGEGDLRGLGRTETATALPPAAPLVPMLTLGIPGSGTTAVDAFGALTLIIQHHPRPAAVPDQPDNVLGS